MEVGSPRLEETFMQHIAFTNCGWSAHYFAEGWYGWSGAGGSLFVFSPTYQASFAYIPTKLWMTDCIRQMPCIFFKR